MELLMGDFSGWLGYLFLITLRVLATFVLSPLFGKNVPNVAKIVLSIMISLLILNAFPLQQSLQYIHVFEYAIACIKEIILGLIIGLFIIIFLASVYIGGQIIDFQMGFSFAQSYDSQLQTSAPLTGKFFNIILILMFFITDSHHVLIQMIYLTFEQIPAGTVAFNQELVKVMIQAFSMTFVLGIRIAMPVMAISLIIQVLLGVVIKTIPQMNFFVIGFPIKIFIGLIIVMIFLPTFINMSDYIFQDMFSAIQKIFEEMSLV